MKLVEHSATVWFPPPVFATHVCNENESKLVYPEAVRNLSDSWYCDFYVLFGLNKYYGTTTGGMQGVNGVSADG